MVLSLILAAQIATHSLDDGVTGRGPDRVAAAAEAALTEAMAAAMAVQFVTCEDAAVRARLGRAADRFKAVQSIAMARIGKDEAARLVVGMSVNPAYLFTPGCPPADELERRVFRFEQSVARLEQELAPAR